MANNINKLFANVACDLSPLSDDFITSLVPDDQVCDVHSSDFIIAPTDVEFTLTHINIHKSPGPDDLPKWLIKNMAPYLANPMCAIFNASILQRHVPSIWKLGNIIPVPKIDSPSSIQSDLRPISLTPTLCKILESFVGRWLLQRIGTKFDPRQFGALRGCSTTHALVSITHQWRCAFDSRESVRALFIDFPKAFDRCFSDRVDYTLLLNILLAFGAPFSLVECMYSFLKGRRHCVKIHDHYSTWTESSAGFPQGTWLGPLSFIHCLDK